MRFLLHPATQRSSAPGIRKARLPKRVSKRVVSPPSVLSSKTVDNTDDTTTNYIQSWGQQCSPNCGCVVRFEATMDPLSGKFSSATYHAKSVIVIKTSQENGGENLKPAMTLRTNRPMFRPCSCNSLHQLASQVTAYLPNKNVLSIGSSMEFAGIRSSPAFRHTVLEKQGLSTNDTHCFDLIEEALTAMVKGHLPKPREQVTIKEAYAKMMSSNSLKSEEQRGEMETEDEFRIDMSAFMQPPRAMSALRMMDMKTNYSFSFNRDSSEYERYPRKSSKETPEEPSKSLDWVSYVDEQARFYEQQESA